MWMCYVWKMCNDYRIIVYKYNKYLQLPCFHISNTQATFTHCLKGSFLLAERVTRMHWKIAEGYQCCATWWSLAFCSSTFPASGWTNSRPLQSQGPFQIGISCVHMEVCECTIIIFKCLRGPWTTKVLFCTISFAWFLFLLGGYWVLKN